jgi:hypothetical protein
MLDEEQPRQQGNRACEVRSQTRIGRQFRRRHGQQRLGEPALARERGHPLHHRLRDRIDLERERHREVLLQADRFEEDAALADDTEVVEPGEPLVGAGDVCGAPAERADFTSIRDGRPGDEIHHQFGGGRIETGYRHAFAGHHRERL